MMTQMTQPNGLFRRIYIFLITALIFAMVFEPIALHAQSKRNNKTRNKEESTDKRKGSGQPFSQQTLEDRAAQLEEIVVSTYPRAREHLPPNSRKGLLDRRLGRSIRLAPSAVLKCL